MDGSGGHQLPLEWYPGPYGYDPYTNTFLPLPYYGYGSGAGVEYIWNPPYQQQGPPYSSSSVPLGRPPQAAARRGRGRGGRHRISQPRQHGGPGLLGSDPSSRRPPQLPPPRRSAPDEPSSSQPPVPVPLPPENREPTPPTPASSSPSSHAMTPPVPDPVKDSHVDVTMTTDAKMDDAQDDVLVGSSGSGTAATDKKKLLPLDPPAPMKSSDVDVSMARRDDGQGDVLGLNVYMAKKRLLSTKASLAADADAAEEEAKAAARKKTRLGWGQGLAKYENRRFKKDDETTHKLLVAHDGTTGEAASSHGSSPPPGSKGHGDNNSLDMAEMRVSQVTTAPALFSKGSSRPLTAAGDLGDPGKNGSISSLTKKAVSPAEVPARFSRKHSPSPAADDQNMMAVGGTDDRGSNSQVHAVPRKGGPPPEDNSDAIAVSELAASQGFDAPPDESSTKFTKVQDIPPRKEKVIVKMVQKPRRIKKMNVLSDEEPETNENCCNENDAAPLVPGIATVTATKNYERMNAEAEDVKKPVNQICHESTANLLAHSLPDKGHGESSVDEHEHVTGKVLVGESNAAPFALGMRSSQAACLAISKTEAPVLENFNEDNSSNEAVCITKSSSKVKKNVPQSVLIANHGDEGNCVAVGSCGQDTVKITFFPDEISAKLANGTIKGDQVRSGAKTAELCSSLKEWNHGAKHHSWKATEKKMASSNIDDGRMAPSDMKTPNSKDNPCNTSDPAAMLTGPAFVQHMMQFDEAMEKKESEKNDDKVERKEENNPVLCVASNHCSDIQLSCEVNSQNKMEKVDSIPSPEGNDLNENMEDPTKDSSPCIWKAWKTLQKGKRIMPSPEVNDLNAPPMQFSNEAPRTYHLASSSSFAALDIVHANSSYIAMDIDLNVPLDVTPLDVTTVDLGSSTAEASMARSSEATDSDATMEISSSQTTTTVTQTAHQQPANQPGSIMLFGRVIYQAPSTGTTNHTPNQGNQIVVSSINMPSNPLVSVTRRGGHGQVHPTWATTTSVWRNSVPNNQQGQQAVLANRILYGGSTSGASASAASPLQLQPGGSALINMMNNQRRQQALANIMRGGVPVVPSPHLIQGSRGGAGLVNFNGFNSVPQPWPFPVVDTSRMVLGLGHAFYYPGGTANQAPAAAATMLSIGNNNGEGASTSNVRAPPAAGRGRGRSGHNSWLSLRRD